MIRLLVQRSLRRISFNFFKRNKAPRQEELQKGFESYKKNEGPSRIKSKLGKVNQQLLNETINEIEKYNETAQYIPKERAIIANSLIKKIISCRGLQSIVDAKSNGSMILDKFIRITWEDIDALDTAEPIVNLFWLAVNANFFLKEVSYNDYITFFNLNASRLYAREIVTVLNVILIRHYVPKNRGDQWDQIEPTDFTNENTKIRYSDLSKDEREAVEQLARSCLANLQQTVEDFYSLTEISTLMRNIGYSDKGFFDETEQLIKHYLLPFNAQRMLAYLTYYAAKGRDLNNSEEKQQVFEESSKFLVENLQFCAFNDLYLFTLLYVKEVDVANELSSKVLIERILNAILQRDELMLEVQKLLDMLELVKGKVSIKYLLQGLRKTEAHMMRQLKEVTPGQFAQFVFLCHDVGYSFVYQEDFEKKMMSVLYAFGLDDLRKVCWANEFIFHNEDFYKKMMNVLEEKVDEIIKDESKYKSPEKVLPFIWILNIRLSKEIVAKFEEYIQHYILRFGFHEIGIFMWSFVHKTKITLKTIFMIVDRYQTLLTELYSNALQHKSSNKSELAFSGIGTWEIMTILWGFNSFQLDKSGEIMATLIHMSILMVHNLLDEFEKIEFIMIVRVFMADRPFFSQIYSDQKEFYDALVSRLQEFMDEFDLQQTTIISYVFAENPIISKDYEGLLVKLVERRNYLKFERVLSDTMVDNSQQSESELEKRFREHI
jgi:hypothetical protein